MLFSEARWMFILYTAGSSVNLPCSAQRAASNISWYTVHTNGSIYPTHSTTEEVNLTLTIKDVRESDAKLYCCKESTANPDFCSHNQTELLLTELQVKVIPATEGQTVTLMCSSSSCALTESPAAYMWYKNREFLYEDWSPWYQELLSDEEAVTYSCAVKGYEDLRAPEVSVDSVTENCFSVTYTKRSMCAHEPVAEEQFCSITYPTDLRVQTTPGNKVHFLTCNTSCPTADPHTLYKWYWNHNAYSDCESQDITMFHSNKDTFSCAVKGNEDVHSAEACTDGTDCRATNYDRRRICALEGSSVTIKAETSVLYCLWIKVKIGEECKKVFTERAGRVDYDDTNKLVLKINDVMRNDSAEYRYMCYSGQCDLPGVMLVVTGLKVTMSPSAVVTEGQRVTLTCSTSCPLADSTNYTWYFNGRPLTPRKDQNKHLILDPVSCENEGNYSCAVDASQTISSAEEGLAVKALEKTVAALNAFKMTLLSLIPPAVLLLHLRTRKKKTVTATAEHNDKQQPGQVEVLYESVGLVATKPATRGKPAEQQHMM